MSSLVRLFILSPTSNHFRNTLVFSFKRCQKLTIMAFQVVLVVKNPPANGGNSRDVWSLGQEDPVEEGTATHFGILSWRIPWTEESGGLWSIGSRRAGHDWSDLAHMPCHYHCVSLEPPASAGGFFTTSVTGKPTAVAYAYLILVFPWAICFHSWFLCLLFTKRQNDIPKMEREAFKCICFILFFNCG